MKKIFGHLKQCLVHIKKLKSIKGTYCIQDLTTANKKTVVLQTI